MKYVDNFRLKKFLDDRIKLVLSFDLIEINMMFTYFSFGSCDNIRSACLLLQRLCGTVLSKTWKSDFNKSASMTASFKLLPLSFECFVFYKIMPGPPIKKDTFQIVSDGVGKTDLTI